MLLRSLYWRIALGFVIFLAAMLAAQATLFLWLVSRAGGPLAEPSADEAARAIAADLGAALAVDPQADVQSFLKKEEAERKHAVFVVMEDGRVIGGGSRLAPEPLLRMVRGRRRFRDGRFGDGPPPMTLGPMGLPRRGPEGGRGSRFMAVAPVVVKGNVVATVAVLQRTPLQQLGPAMVVVAAALLVGGTALAAASIFGPARRRLRHLEDATRRLGAGDLSARAPESGGDEVAALAQSFNRMASDLARRADEIAEVDRARRRLLADVSHELTTPLTAIRGYVETLGMPGLALDVETRARYVQIIDAEVHRLERIIQDLLDLARLEEGGASLQIEDVPVEQLFGRVAARHERESVEKQVTIETSIAPGAEIVAADALRLEQALQNLAANALRHTPPRGRVELRADLDDAAIVLTVRDTGAGIPPEHLPSIFDRFYKVGASRGGGSGLGLSIVKAIVERHGGRITVASEPGRGTTFRIVLPAERRGVRLEPDHGASKDSPYDCSGRGVRL